MDQSLSILRSSSDVQQSPELFVSKNQTLITQPGRDARDELVSRAQDIEKVSTPKSQQVVGNMLTELQTFLSATEAGRVLLKGPYLDSANVSMRTLRNSLSRWSPKSGGSGSS
jgi:hypothetical protein